jgi:pilus assembly protein CpaB
VNRRALAVALVLGALGAALLALYMHRFSVEMSGGERVKLLVAIKKIDRGALIAEDAVAEREVPIAYVEDRAVKAAERDKIIGLRSSATLQAQETLMWSDLAIQTEDRDLSSLVQPGSRGVTVRAATGEDTNANTLIRPGDYVDIVVTMHDPHEQEVQSSVVLLQKVLVLAVGADTEPQAFVDKGHEQNQSATRDRLLTLSLSLEEAQLLALATEKGHLSVAVRNPDDARVIDGLPDMPSSALFDSKSRSDLQRPRRTAAAAGPMRIDVSGPR